MLNVFKKLELKYLIILIFIGCYFRLTNLTAKIFWVDEIATAVRVSGYTIAEVTTELEQQELIEFEDLLVYQRISSDRDFKDSWSALKQSPEHAPLYFILLRFWMQFWGNSITVMRSFSAGLSLLIFPALYWLCQELWANKSVSCMAIGLMAVSPFYVAYAQEARPYSLWTVTILLMSASLLRAIKHNHWRDWGLYSCCLTLGCYTSLFSIYIAAFQAVYYLLIPIKNKLKNSPKYLTSCSIAGIAFAPWVWNILNHLDILQANTSWMRGNFNLTEIIAVFIGTILLIFGDLPISPSSDPVQMAIVLIIIVMTFGLTISLASYRQKKLMKFGLILTVSSSIFLVAKYIYLDLVSIIGALVALLILSITTYSLYYLITQNNRDRWLLIICLIFSLPTSLLIADTINQGQSSTAPRYLIPLQLGIQIAVAYTLANQLKLTKITNCWRTITVSLLLVSIFSCVRNLNLSPFYQKGRNIHNPAIAQIIKQTNTPLVLVESSAAMDALSLAYSLSPQTKYQIINSDRDLIFYGKQFEKTFLLKPSVKIIRQLQQHPQIKLTQIYQSHLFSVDQVPLDLWEIIYYR